MKKLFAILIVLTFFPLLVQAATQVDPQDFGKLVRVVKEQDQDIDQLLRIVQGMDQAISRLQNTPRQGGSQPTRSQEVSVKDSQARQIANRALAWAIYSQVVDAQGNKPDIEDVERMLTPLENGNMSPLKFETGLASALKARGWKLVDCQKPLSDTDIKKIVDEAVARAITDLTRRVTTLEGEVRELRGLVKKAQDTADGADGKAERALTAVAGIQIPEPVTIDTSQFATTTELRRVESLIPDTSCLVTESKLKQVSDCLDAKIAGVKADVDKVGQALTRTLNSNDKDRARAELYGGLMERYQARGYRGADVHIMVQLYLRTAYWSENLIKKAAKENGADLVPIDQIQIPQPH